MINPSKNTRDLMNACMAMSAATSALLRAAEVALSNAERCYQTGKDRDYGYGIVLTSIPTLQHRSKAHNRKINRRNK